MPRLGLSGVQALSYPISVSCSERAPRWGIVQGHQAGLGAADRRKGETFPMSLEPAGLCGKPTAPIPAPSRADGCALPQNKHALLDITPSAVERLNYVQYYPVVVFCEPESRQGIKAMRQWLAPDSRKSSRRLYAQANKMKKYCSHLFTATISLSGSGNAWYEQIQDIIRTQQNQPVWTTAEQVWGMGSLWQGLASWGCCQAGDGVAHSSPWLGSHVCVIPTPQADVTPEANLDLLNPPSRVASGYLTCDSHANSDYDDTDGEASAYTDGEAEDACEHPGLARSSEPAQLAPSHGLDSSEPTQLAPSHSQSEQVRCPTLLQEPTGDRTGWYSAWLESNSHPHGTGTVTSGSCRVQLCICVQLWVSRLGHSPCPAPDPSHLFFLRCPNSHGRAGAMTASGTLVPRGGDGRLPGLGTVLEGHCPCHTEPSPPFCPPGNMSMRQ